jgi:hypothetical protein
MIDGFISKAMTGLSILGQSFSVDADSAALEKHLSLITFILMGEYDLVLKCGLYFSLLKKTAENEEDLEIPEVLVALERLKNMHRETIAAVFEMEQDKVTLIAKLKETNKPHEMGTVSEIATKYGISKSEVRRRKAEGTLHELVTPASL